MIISNYPLYRYFVTASHSLFILILLVLNDFMNKNVFDRILSVYFEFFVRLRTWILALYFFTYDNRK